MTTQAERNRRYNAERRHQAELMKRDLDRDKVLTEIYQEGYDRIQKQIDQFYMSYADKNGLSRDEAMKRVSEMDVTKFNDKAAKAVREKDFSPETNKWLKDYNLKMRVSRLELLKQELSLEIQNLTAEADDVFQKARQDEMRNEYKRQAGILGNSATGSKKRLEAILGADFYGQTFSSRVWGGLGLRETLQRDVFGSLNRIYTDMMGYKQERDRLARKFGTSKSNAQRLLKTEIARINADLQYQMLQENGFTHMIFVAEPGACDLCGPLDQVAVPIDKVEKGVNMYPMHPNCRCSAYGHIKMDYKAGGSTIDGYKSWGNASKTAEERQNESGEITNENKESNNRLTTTSLTETEGPKKHKSTKSVEQSQNSTGHNFKDHKEAERYALENGVQFADFSKMKPEWYNSILEYLDRVPIEARPVVLTDAKTMQQLSGTKIKRSAKSYYGVTQYLPGDLRKVNGEYVQFRDGSWVGFNSTSYKTLLSIEEAKEKIEKQYFSKTGKYWNMMRTGTDTIAHEFGHVLDNYKPTSDSFGWKNIAKRWYEESGFDHLRSPSEAWADAVSLKWNGKAVPGYVEEYMTKYAQQYYGNEKLFDINQGLSRLYRNKDSNS